MPDAMISPSVEPANFAQMASALAEAALSHSRTTPTLLSQLLVAFPEHPRGHAAAALMLVLSGRAEDLPKAQASAQKALALVQHSYDRAFDSAFATAALNAASGKWRDAIEQLETALIAAPEETLAFKICHGLRFMLGDKRGMLASARAQLARLDRQHAHRGFVMGCLAFACEENGFYAEAEKIGEEAVALAPADVWGLHAVSHVHEMQGRVGEGIAWLVRHEAQARKANNFGFHLFWHLALFLIEQGDFPSVFALYDREIRAEKTDDFRDLANASSLLMRLHLLGIPVGNRWEELADKAESRLRSGYLPFADLHALMALQGAGRHEAISRCGPQLAALHEHSPARQDDSIHHINRSYIAGFEALSAGRANEAFTHFNRYLGRDAGLGGSDAQRDIFTQIALDAGSRGGNGPALLPILSERMMRRGARNRFAQSQLAKFGPGLPMRALDNPVMAPVRASFEPRHLLAVLSL